MTKAQALTTANKIESYILMIRGQKVMLSTQLSTLYGVEPRVLAQAVKRNRRRFPADFVFQLSAREQANLKSQIVISSWGGRRAQPYAFSEQGVAMLSSVLRSARAVRVNIQIMRAFVKLREMLATHRELARRLAELERRMDAQDEGITEVFEAIRHLMAPANKAARRIGFAVTGKG